MVFDLITKDFIKDLTLSFVEYFSYVIYNSYTTVKSNSVRFEAKLPSITLCDTIKFHLKLMLWKDSEVLKN